MLSCQTWQKRSFLHRLVLRKVRRTHRLQVSSAHKCQLRNARKALIGATVRMAIRSAYGVTETSPWRRRTRYIDCDQFNCSEATLLPTLECVRPNRLTPKESQIARLILAGMRNAEIAETLGVSVQDAKNRLCSIFDKIGVDSRLELALYLMSHPERWQQ
jgi:DNA-binding NarL/FixJ family response regulator